MLFQSFSFENKEINSKHFNDKEGKLTKLECFEI